MMAAETVMVFMAYSFLLRMMSAPMTPGTQPMAVRISTIRKDPQPLSITDSGGKMMANRTRRHDMKVVV